MLLRPRRLTAQQAVATAMYRRNNCHLVVTAKSGLQRFTNDIIRVATIAQQAACVNIQPK